MLEGHLENQGTGNKKRKQEIGQKAVSAETRRLFVDILFTNIKEDSGLTVILFMNKRAEQWALNFTYM